ncbi:MAG: type II secretion system protein [Planctomycetota bacterium]
MAVAARIVEMDRCSSGVVERDRGFTLVELLVVIAIIGVLAGILTPSLIIARKRSAMNNARQEIQRLTAALESYQAEHGDYPPTDMEEEYDAAGNGINEGIESLVAHLAARGLGGPFYEFKEDALENLDGDALLDATLLARLDWFFGDSALREIVDPWGTPYIYLHNRDYERAFTVLDRGGKKATAQAGRSEKIATFHSPTTYQIWSAGPDLENENGDGDDIGSWD